VVADGRVRRAAGVCGGAGAPARTAGGASLRTTGRRVRGRRTGTSGRRLSQSAGPERIHRVRLNLESCDDATLLAASEHVDEAFAAFYRRYLDDVLRLCVRRGLDSAAAADVTAETFASALLARRRYRAEVGSARAWLLGIAVHKIGDDQRRRARDHLALRRLALAPVELSEQDRADYAALVAQERSSTATDALAHLPEDQRTAVYARVVEGESYEAIARDLRISEGVARQRVSRGLRTLRVRLGKEPS
jgi:RNA polymerase sigma factor (sigma-70 family)